MRLFYLILGVCLIFAESFVFAISWPMPPTDSSGRIGNSYGEYQNYGSVAYMHPGLDILAPAGTPVYAVKSGYVKAVLTTSANLHWRVAIGDSAGAVECDGWLYAHLSEMSIMVSEGEWVEEGTLLGDLVHWPVADFHHLHFVKIRHSGVVWSSDWQFIGNPLDELENISDPDAPVFENAFGAQKFAFSNNESSDYFAIGQAVSGDVDIICKVWDYINHYDWKLAPYKIEYRIEGDNPDVWTNSICFTGLLDYANNVSVIYRDDASCNSRGDYNYRDYYLYLTNTDGDSVIETSDAAYSWETAEINNGNYTVYARAYDRAGNSTTDSMSVAVENFFSLNGSISFDDNNPDLSGVNVIALLNGQDGLSDDLGNYSVADIGGGLQTIQFSRAGYLTIDTTIMMNQNGVINLTMSPGDYVLGDANYDTQVNVGDAVYIINYVFKNGPPPTPYASGDANGDSKIDIGDAVYLVNYVFRGGPPPGGKSPQI
ncbi:MAG: peptidoglycan DD-metalloendopeptidase family protein [candidate division Zixibacteria bacterium]|nr:peptidoglycan DD-metalloendopeptidase family protein [candidate division Zixibacteria bacterium]